MTRKEWKTLYAFSRWNGYTMRPKDIPTGAILEETREERYRLADRNGPYERLSKLYPFGGFIDNLNGVVMRKYFGSRLKGFKTNYLKSNR